MQGYASADDKKRVHDPKSSPTKHNTDAASLSQTHKKVKLFNFADFNLREEIEKFSAKIELKRKKFE